MHLLSQACSCSCVILSCISHRVQSSDTERQEEWCCRSAKYEGEFGHTWSTAKHAVTMLRHECLHLMVTAFNVPSNLHMQGDLADRQEAFCLLMVYNMQHVWVSTPSARRQREFRQKQALACSANNNEHSKELHAIGKPNCMFHGKCHPKSQQAQQQASHLAGTMPGPNRRKRPGRR